METYDCWKEGKPKVNIGSWIEVTVHALEINSITKYEQNISMNNNCFNII